MERVDLYSYVLPPGENIPISVEPFLVDDSVTTEVEIQWAVKRLQNHLSGGPLGMQAEHLKGWLAAERKKEKEEAASGEETTESNRGGVYIIYGGIKLGDGGGTCVDGVQGGATGGGGHVAGGGPDYQGKKGLPWNWPHGGDVEGSGGNFKLTAHSLRNLPRLPPRILGRSRHRYRHPRGQAASEVSGIEGGGPVRDIPGPAQDV